MKKRRTATTGIQTLWHRGFFKGKKIQTQVPMALSSSGCNPSEPALAMALNRAEYLTRGGKPGSYTYIQSNPPDEEGLTENVLAPALVKQMGQRFTADIADLDLNYGKSGSCTAFLLRKILEKMIFLAFAKQGEEDKLKDPTGNLWGLTMMLDLCVKTKVRGRPFLMGHTAREIEGIKFLGDVAAHNPLTTVEMKTIVPVMPFIVTAYGELASRL